MNCQQARQNLMLYLDSEGDAELHFRISDHLAMCPACAEWFAREGRFQEALKDRLAAGKATPKLWERVLNRAGLTAMEITRRRWLVFGGSLAAAAILLAAGIVVQTIRSKNHPGQSPPLESPGELARIAADWHKQLLEKTPDIVSTSDQEVERYLKNKVPFRVHCPPRTDVNFTVKGAGVCTFKDREPAAYIVGQVDGARVSLLVLDRASLQAFPEESALLMAQKCHQCRQGDYQMVAGVVAENLVLVIGTSPPGALEKLFNAYGSYHGG